MALEEQRKLANDCIQGAEAGSTDQEVGPGESQLHLSLNSREEAYVCRECHIETCITKEGFY